MEVYDITTRELSKDSFKFTVSLASDTIPLFTFDYKDIPIDTFYNYSIIHKGGDDIVYENQLLVKNGAVEIIDSSFYDFKSLLKTAIKKFINV